MTYRKSHYSFDLPHELIAKSPLKDRADSRLLVVERDKERFYEIPFREFPGLLSNDDQLIFNNTKVIPARLLGKRETGGKVEVLLLREVEEGIWSALTKPARKIKMGTTLDFGDLLKATVVEEKPEGIRLLRFSHEGSFYEVLDRVGEVPLPHYMERASTEEDKERYQTRLASKPGAVAAPTAGLHFSDALLSEIRKKGVDIQSITLHVGWGTFKPMQVDDIREHKMHEEHFFIEEATSKALHSHAGRQIVVGTTTLRTLETTRSPGHGSTSIYIYPGFTFQFTKHLLTNFHLPESSLFVLSCTFGGEDLIKSAYQYAIQEKFRFYSYGDAMLIL